MQIYQKVDSLYPKVQFEIPNDSAEYELFDPLCPPPKNLKIKLWTFDLTNESKSEVINTAHCGVSPIPHIHLCQKVIVKNRRKALLLSAAQGCFVII